MFGGIAKVCGSVVFHERLRQRFYRGFKAGLTVPDEADIGQYQNRYDGREFFQYAQKNPLEWFKTHLYAFEKFMKLYHPTDRLPSVYDSLSGVYPDAYTIQIEKPALWQALPGDILLLLLDCLCSAMQDLPRFTAALQGLPKSRAIEVFRRMER